MDATPPLVDGDVEHRALDGDQPGVEGLVDGRHPSSSTAVVIISQSVTSPCLVSSVRSSNSHPDLLVIQHPTFLDHTGPQHWTFTF